MGMSILILSMTLFFIISYVIPGILAYKYTRLVILMTGEKASFEDVVFVIFPIVNIMYAIGNIETYNKLRPSGYRSMSDIFFRVNQQ